MSKMLIVEDEKDLAGELRDWFNREKYVTEVAHCGASALDLLRVYQYDIILLDWMLPEVNGLEVCRQYRRTGGKTPIIMLTARKSAEDLELGLDCGADYYVKKPVSLRELSASVRAALRRGSGLPESNVLSAGDITLDTASHTVSRNGSNIHLEPKEYNLLEFLMRHPRQIFSPETLLDRVWPSDTVVSCESVRTYIKGLRKKLDLKGQESIIKNIRGVGYKLDLDE